MTDTLPDYKNIDYRGFAFVIHNVHGMLLLHCTRKPKKGPHYQLPGGHIDDFEFEYAADKSNSNSPNRLNDVLLEAAKMGTARELFEETGMDVRGQLERLDPVPLYGGNLKGKGGRGLMNMLDNKLYFSLNVTDDDFLRYQEGLKQPNDEHGNHLSLKISHEHSGYIFVNDPMQSIEKIVKHSGGTGSRALRMSMTRSHLNSNDSGKGNGNGSGNGNGNGSHASKTQVNAKKSNVPNGTRSSDPYNSSNGNGNTHTVDLFPPHRRSEGLFSCFQNCC